MMHPNDQAVRRRDFIVGDLDRLTREKSAHPLLLEREQVRLLLDAPPLSEIDAHQKECTKNGFLAGRVLACLYLCDRFKDHAYFVPSMNRAVFVSTSQGQDGAKFGDGTPMPKSERTVRNAWRDYNTVAPLWAAASMGSLGYPFAPERELFSPKWIGQFLGVSAALRRFGTSFIPQGAHPAVPILDATSTWRLPDEVAPANLKSTRVPMILKQILQKYRVPKK